MEDEDFDRTIRNKIKEADITLPDSMEGNIKNYTDSLPPVSKKPVKYRKYAGLAAAIVLIFCLCTMYKIYIRDLAVRNVSSKNNSYVVTAAEKKQLAQEGYITDKQDNGRYIPAVSAATDKVGSPYTSVEKLAADSDVIIEGQVIGIRYFDYHPDLDFNQTFTESKVKVFKSYNERVKPGDIITFIEWGGITTQYIDYLYSGAIEKNMIMTEEEIEKARDTKVQHLDEGVPVMQPGEKVLIFGQNISSFHFKDFPVTEVAYSPLGSYEGKFIIQDNIVQRYEPDDCPPGYYNIFKMTEEQIDKKIKSSLKK